MNDQYYMKIAMALARTAERYGEVPVGAVIVKEGRVIAHGYNLRESTQDPTTHAEIIAIQRAAQRLGSWRLYGCTLYVTLEPCPMCAGALVNARVDRVVYGADDLKAGYCGTLHNTPQDARLNHRMQVTKGVLAQQCAQLLTNFFRAKRRPSGKKSEER